MGNVNLFTSLKGNNPYTTNSVKQQNSDAYKNIPLGTNSFGLKSRNELIDGENQKGSKFLLDQYM